MAARGVRGIVGLARKFRIMDDDSSGVLSMAEFKKGMRETSLDLSEQVSEAILILSSPLPHEQSHVRITESSSLILIKMAMVRLTTKSLLQDLE